MQSIMEWPIHMMKSEDWRVEWKWWECSGTYMYATTITLDDEDVTQSFSIDADQSILRMEKNCQELENQFCAMMLFFPKPPNCDIYTDLTNIIPNSIHACRAMWGELEEWQTQQMKSYSMSRITVESQQVALLARTDWHMWWPWGE